MLYIIRREDNTMLTEVIITKRSNPFTFDGTSWTDIKDKAIKFENAEEAQATIDFISNVIDWELGEELYYEQA